jgi:hypothetical protein
MTDVKTVTVLMNDGVVTGVDGLGDLKRYAVFNVLPEEWGIMTEAQTTALYDAQCADTDTPLILLVKGGAILGAKTHGVVNLEVTETGLAVKEADVKPPQGFTRIEGLELGE